MTERIKILFLAAHPAGARHRFRLDKEIREISHKIRSGTNHNSFELVSEWAVRPSDLQAALLRHRPHIVHFSGRGNKAGGITLEDDFGKPRLVNEQALARLFRILKDNVLVVVLNAGYAKDQARGISETIDCTIGMNATVGDKSAVVFAAHFYQSLAFGRSVKDSFELAVNQLELEGMAGAGVPELLVRDGVDASQSFVIPQLPYTPEGTEIVNHLNPGGGNPRSSSGETSRSKERIHGKEKQHTLIPLLTLIPAIISAGLITEMVARFVSGEGDWLDTTVAVLQSILIVLAIILGMFAATSLMQPHNLLVRKVAHLAILKAHKPKKRTLIAGTLLLLALGLRLSLPALAHSYNERGFQNQRVGNLTRARESYQRAVRLNPRYAQAHYNLATIYEDLQPEEAIKEYLLAIASDSNLYPAYNNLARLYILRGKDKDYDYALQILERAINLSPSDERVQYSLYKNLGWACYALKNYAQAEMYLRRAISLREKEGAAAAHCLLAYVLKEQGKPGVSDECEDCLRFAPGQEDVEAKWINDAKEQLMKGASQ